MNEEKNHYYFFETEAEFEEFKYWYKQIGKDKSIFFESEKGENILIFHGSNYDENYYIEKVNGQILLADKIYLCHPRRMKKNIKKYVNKECADKVQLNHKGITRISHYNLISGTKVGVLVIGKGLISKKIFNKKAIKEINNGFKN